MSGSLKNIILILALCAVAIMCVGLFLYDYIPSSLTVSKPNQFEINAEITSVEGDAKNAQKLLTSESQSVSSTSADTPAPVKTNIVLKEQSVSKTDLAVYQQSGSYVKGKADPFAEAKPETKPEDTSSQNDGTTTSNNTVTSSGNSGSSSNTVQSDGTFYNSKNKK